MELDSILPTFNPNKFWVFFVGDPFSVLDLGLWIIGRIAVVSSCRDIGCPYSEDALNLKDVFNITVFIVFQSGITSSLLAYSPYSFSVKKKRKKICSITFSLV